MLKLEGLTFSHILQRGQTVMGSQYVFDMQAYPGQITAISGSSGSGKSTLLDLIAGFLHPRAGTIDLDGRDLVNLKPEQRPVSILFQAETVFDHLSAADNVALGLNSRLPRPQRLKQVQQALAEVGLPGLGAQNAGTLSGGQKQRVALARTLLRDRPVLLLDEPFSALDDDTRATIRALVSQLTRDHNWHTVLVSHHGDDIDALAKRRYDLIDGRLNLAPEAPKDV